MRAEFAVSLRHRAGEQLRRRAADSPVPASSRIVEAGSDTNGPSHSSYELQPSSRPEPVSTARIRILRCRRQRLALYDLRPVPHQPKTQPSPMNALNPTPTDPAPNFAAFIGLES